MCKKDFVVAKLEGLWWFDESKYMGLTLSEAPKIAKREEWKYRLLIRLPNVVEMGDVSQAKEKVRRKKQLKMASQIEFYKMKEGKSVQILQVGPFDNEPETLLHLQEFIQSKQS